MTSCSSPLPTPLAAAHRWCRAQGWLRRFTLGGLAMMLVVVVGWGVGWRRRGSGKGMSHGRAVPPT